MRESDSSLRMFLVSIQQDVRQTSPCRREHEFYFRPFAGSVIIKAFRAYRTFATGFAVNSKLRSTSVPAEADECVRGQLNCFDLCHAAAMTPLWFAEELDNRASMPQHFRGRLQGLYGWGSDEQVYVTLPLDKRAALLLVSRRLTQKDLWKAVGRIVNVYGIGGVGMYFSALIDLESDLGARKDFTRRFARHRDNTGGFLERSRRHASLHFLYIDEPGLERRWHVHLDLYGPLGSISTLGRHLFLERWRRFRPDWQLMKDFVE